MGQSREELTLELKKHIIEYLNLLEITPEEIENDELLFGPESKLELDSIDSVELIVLLEREFDVRVTNPTEGRKIFADVNSIVDHIVASREN